MDLKTYVAHALRTESPVNEAMVQRFRSPMTLRLFHQTAQRVRNIGARMDGFKRHLFYGTELPLTSVGELPHICQVTPELLARFTAPNIRLLHGVTGLVTEVGELMDALLRHLFSGEELDRVNLIEEVGDLCWYMAIILDVLGADPEEVLGININKLRARYPEKFTAMEATVRDLMAERAVLEAGAE